MKIIDNAAASKDRKILEDLERLREKLRRPGNKEMTFAEILEQHPLAAPYVFSGRDLRNITFDGADLRGVNTYGSDLDRCSFRNARIAGAGFDMSKVSRAQLRQASDWLTHVNDHEWQIPRRLYRRYPGDRFSCAPWLSELMILPPSLIEKASEDISATEEEERALLAGELAIALTPINALEFLAALSDDRSKGSELVKLTGTQALGYVEALNKRVSAASDEDVPIVSIRKVTVPSTGLLQMLAGFDCTGPAAEDATTLEPSCLRVACPTDGGHPSWEYISGQDFPISTLGFPNDQRRRNGVPDVRRVRSAYLRPLYFFKFDEDKQ